MASRIYTSIVTVGSVEIYEVTSDPNGALSARRGSFAIRSDAGEVSTWQNTDGGTTWVSVSGSFVPTVASVSPLALSNSTGTQIILVDTVPMTLNLPAIVDGRGLIYIKDRTGNASGVTPITITPDGAETIDGGATLAIDGNYASIVLYGNGTEWSLL